MKDNKKNSFSPIEYVSENEKIQMGEYIKKYNKRLERNNAILDMIFRSVKYILFSPLAIATRLLSVLFKIGGSVTAIGLPYGVYCIYKTVILLKDNVALGDIKQTTFVCLFVIFPFTAFAISLGFEKLADYFYNNK